MTDIFDNKGSDNEPVVKTAEDVISIFTDKLMAIKKADGTPKYDSIEKALDALNASQEHITRLEQEAKDRQALIDEATAKANKTTELEEVIRRMSEGNVNTEKPEGSNPANKGGLSEADAAQLVRQILNEEKQTTVAIQNVSVVQDKLVARFGSEKAVEVLEAKAKELGVTRAKLKELSATSPNMVLALFGENSSPVRPNTSTFSLGANKPAEDEIKLPEKSLMSGRGATDKNRQELMQKIKDKVYKKNEIST